MAHPKVFVPEPMPRVAFTDLEAVAEVVFGRTGRAYSEAELVECVGDVEAVIFTSRDPIAGTVIRAAPHLRVLTKAGAKTVNVDYEAARDKGIPVTWTPNANAVSVAEHTITLMLAVAKRLFFVAERLKAGGWRDETIMGVELAGKTAAIVGLGGVGSAVAHRLSAFDMRLLGHDPFKSAADMRALGVEPVELDRIFTEADFLLILCELTEATRQLVCEVRLKSMKSNAIVVNTARGAIIDESALCRALGKGWIAGAGLDVFETEPLPPDHPFLILPNLVTTPHSASYTHDGHLREARWAAEDVKAILEGCPPVHWRPMP